MLKNITALKTFAVCLLLLLTLSGCKQDGQNLDETLVNLPKEPPLGFSNYVNEGLGITFNYLTDWGMPDVTEGETGTYRINFGDTPLTPSLILITKDFPDKEELAYRQFLVGPKEDCERLTNENKQIVNEYLGSSESARDPNLTEVLEKNMFHCEVDQVANVAALVSYNPLRFQQETDTNVAAPIPVPVIDYRLVLPKNPDYQAVNASLLVFDNEAGSTYQDYQNNELSSDKTEAINNFKQLMASLQIGQIDEKKLELNAPDTQKRRRPTAEKEDIANFFNENEFVNFSYPQGWQVKKIIDNALEIWPNDSAEKDIAPVQIKILANNLEKDLDSFLSDSINLTTDLSETGESLQISGQTWQKRNNLRGVYPLEVLFAAKKNYVIEVDILLEPENNNSAEIQTIINSLRLK